MAGVYKRKLYRGLLVALVEINAAPFLLTQQRYPFRGETAVRAFSSVRALGY